MDDFPTTIELSFQVESDSNSFIERQCPNEECRERFKVHEDDWERIEVVHCPSCSNTDSKDDVWATEDQDSSMISQSEDHVANLFGNALDRWTDQLNESLRSGFIRIESSGRRVPPPPLVLPSSQEPMSHEYTCNHCSVRYSLDIDSSVCPGCGNENTT